MAGHDDDIWKSTKILIYTADWKVSSKICFQLLSRMKNIQKTRRLLEIIDREPVELSCVFHYVLKLRILDAAIRGELELDHSLRNVVRSLRYTTDRVVSNIDSEMANNQFAFAFKIWMKLQLGCLTEIKQKLYGHGDAPDIFTDDALDCYNEALGQQEEQIRRKAAVWATPIILAEKPSEMENIIDRFKDLCADADQEVKAVALFNIPFVVEYMNMRVKNEVPEYEDELSEYVRNATVELVQVFCNEHRDAAWMTIHNPLDRVAIRLRNLIDNMPAAGVQGGEDLTNQLNNIIPEDFAGPGGIPNDRQLTVEGGITEWLTDQQGQFSDLLLVLFRTKFHQMVLTAKEVDDQRREVKLVSSQNGESWVMDLENLSVFLEISELRKWMNDTSEMNTHGSYFDRILGGNRWWSSVRQRLSEIANSFRGTVAG